MLSLEARYRFWTGVEREIVARRQPAGVEAVRRGLHGPQRESPLVDSPGDLRALRAAIDASFRGKPWPLKPGAGRRARKEG